MLSAYARSGLVLLLAGGLSAQTAAEPDFELAYKDLKIKEYDAAIAHFRAGLKRENANAGVHKDLAYTLLKTGDNAAARDEFAAAIEINRHDDAAAMEFAFLAYETGKPVEARRTFDRLRKQGSTAVRATAETAFQNIDRPLAEGIIRWQEALARSANPNDPALFSAHWELARLAEQRDELPLASEHYEICRAMKPQLGEILLIEARIWQQLNRVEDSKAAALAASRSTNPRTAEQGRELWGSSRYPYPYEFVNAIAVDPQNLNLRHELGFLYLAMDKKPDAIQTFQQILKLDPHDEVARKQLDSLERAKGRKPDAAPTTTGASSATADPRVMGFKSLSLGYARDAIKYLRQAHDNDPDDMEIMLKLGWAYNYAHDDQSAIAWFDRARHASDPVIAAEAQKAYNNLKGSPSTETTLWMLPMYSSRWHDLFSYGQIKHNLPLSNKWISLYLSARFIGDVKSSIPQNPIAPTYLSDSAFIAGLGASTRTWHHLTGWVEAGESMKYLPFRSDVGAAVPDYRGGVNFAKGFGHLLGSSTPGPFFEGTFDTVYVSRYGKDWIFASQNRSGWTFHPASGMNAELLFSFNNTHDLKNQYWAETAEFGPGVKLHLPRMHPGVYFSADLLRGVYTNNLGNPRRPNYDDVRVGFWYAFSK